MPRLGLIPGICLMLAAALTGCSSAPPAETPLPVISPTLERTQTNTQAPSSTFTAVPTQTKTPTATATQTPTSTFSPTPTPAPAVHICDPAVRTFNGHFFSSWPIDPELPFKTDRTYSYGTKRLGNPLPHHGLDITLSAGTEVYAVEDGIVSHAGDDLEIQYGDFPNYYGNLIVIEHQISGFDQEVFTLYGHLSEVLVETGDSVAAGELIGKVGNSGIATGSHLHFEVRTGSGGFNEVLNPELWLPPRSTIENPRGSLAGYILDPTGHFAAADNIVIEYFTGPDLPSHTTTYTSTILAPGLNPDPYWQESFAVMDLAAGQYHLSFYLNGWEELEFELLPDKITLIGICLQE